MTARWSATPPSPSRADVESAIDAAVDAAQAAAAMPSHARAAVLDPDRRRTHRPQGRDRAPSRRRGRQAPRPGPHRDRARRLRLPPGRRGSHPDRRRGDPDGPRPPRRAPRRHHPPLPPRTHLGDHPVQLSGPPRGPQAGARDRLRRHHGPQGAAPGSRSRRYLLAEIVRREPATPRARSPSCSAPTTTPRRCSTTRASGWSPSPARPVPAGPSASARTPSG